MATPNTAEVTMPMVFCAVTVLMRHRIRADMPSAPPTIWVVMLAISSPRV